MKNVFIVAAKRTPITHFLSKVSRFKATDLAALAINAAINSINIKPNNIDEVILGNVLQTGQGQLPAKQASIKASIPTSVSATTVNKGCASGLKSIVFGAQSIELGQNNSVIVGGFESMSNSVHLLMNNRRGNQFGNEQMIDSLAYDGMTCPFNNIALGLCAEKTVQDLKISRQLQDDYCHISYERTINAINSGRFNHEIVPIKLSENEEIKDDEEYKKYLKEKIPILKPIYSKVGTITGANSAKLNDGACALILMSEEKVKQLKIKPLARIVGYADAEVDPIDFSIAISKGVNKVLKQSGLKMKNIDYFEINEAFAASVLANIKLMDIGIEKVNLNGGAISLGHPLGMTGARIVQSLITVLKSQNQKLGLASISNGGGGSTSIIIENLK